MSRDARVGTTDLALTLDYLEGLVLVLQTLAAEGRGANDADDLTEALSNLDGFARAWVPMRSQRGDGMGYADTAENLVALRERLVEGYTDAAL